MPREYNNTLKQIVSHYGVEEQAEQCREELLELGLALRKLQREGDREKWLPHIIDEIADVQIMIDQLRIGYGIGDMVDERIRYKIERQKRRITDGQ